MSNNPKSSRKPVGNFFIKPKLQFKLTYLFVLAAFLASFFTISVVFLLTRIDHDGLEGLRTAWFFIKAVFPGFYIAVIVSMMVGLILGLLASRKVALPIYKVEQWMKQLSRGDFTGKLGMRDTDFWGDMASLCNNFSENLRQDLLRIEQLSNENSPELGEEVKKFLKKYKFKN